MAIKVGINGFGRIGRMVFRAATQNFKDDIEIVVAIRVSQTDSGVTGMSTGCGRSMRRKTRPVSGAAGRSVSSTF